MYVILADDQYDVRCALACLLENEADLQLAHEASNAAELLTQLDGKCPDLVLLDWELPGMSIPDLIKRIHTVCPEAQLLALSVRPEARDEALQAGVLNFASKGDPPELLLAAVRKCIPPVR